MLVEVVARLAAHSPALCQTLLIQVQKRLYTDCMDRHMGLYGDHGAVGSRGGTGGRAATAALFETAHLGDDAGANATGSACGRPLSSGEAAMIIAQELLGVERT